MAGRGGRQGREGPQWLGRVVSEVLARSGAARFDEHRRLTAAWREAAGDWAAHSAAVKGTRGYIEVRVRTSALLQEMMFRRDELLQGLRTRLPDWKIRGLRFRLGSKADFEGLS
ncbi:MAG: DUF721 domain-containing protein [Thermogutta sp.]|nr:DUF721 domain-containing protein [Thermogutta sp.]